MQDSNIYNSRKTQFRFKKILKRKVFLSNEAKKVLLIACYEAQKYQTYVNLDLLLYALISQPKAFSSRLFSLTVSQFRNNKDLTSKVLGDRIQKINNQNLKSIKSSEFSVELQSENKKTPWLTIEVKEVLKSAVKSALQTNKKIVIINTKHLLFELLSKESIRDFLRNLVN